MRDRIYTDDKQFDAYITSDRETIILGLAQFVEWRQYPERRPIYATVNAEDLNVHIDVADLPKLRALLAEVADEIAGQEEDEQ